MSVNQIQPVENTPFVRIPSVITNASVSKEKFLFLKLSFFKLSYDISCMKKSELKPRKDMDQIEKLSTTLYAAT